VAIHLVSFGSDDFTGNRDIRSGKPDAVEFQLEVALTNEVPGLLVRSRFLPDSFPGKNTLSKLPEAVQVADYRITNIGGG